MSSWLAESVRWLGKQPKNHIFKKSILVFFFPREIFRVLSEIFKK